MTEHHQQIVSALYKALYKRTMITKEALLSKTRNHNVVMARKVIAVLLYNTGMDVWAVGEAMGRDHSTASFHKNKHENNMKNLHRYNELYTYMKHNLDLFLGPDVEACLKEIKELEGKKSYLDSRIQYYKKRIKKFTDGNN